MVYHECDLTYTQQNCRVTPNGQDPTEHKRPNRINETYISQTCLKILFVLLFEIKSSKDEELYYPQFLSNFLEDV